VRKPPKRRIKPTSKTPKPRFGGGKRGPKSPLYKEGIFEIAICREYVSSCT
jgi:hypothetical protein